MSESERQLKIVTIGGGTGSFTVLSGLKHYPVELTAIVAMSDSGGSTGMLRTELGVLPPGDVRQCIVALSRSPELMLNVMNYRFENGGLEGHNFGNLLISALEKVSGDFGKAVEHVCEILSVEGRVIPATLDNVHLAAKVGRRWVRGEHIIRENDLTDLKEVRLEPGAVANPKALDAIKHADVIVVGPGGFYTSLIPNFLVEGIPSAFQRASAKKIFVTNLMNKHGHTAGHTVKSFADDMERYCGTSFDYVLYNTELPSRRQVRQYATHTGQQVLKIDKRLPGKFVGAKMLSRALPTHLPKPETDPISRTLIRHDSEKLARAIMRSIKREIV